MALYLPYPASATNSSLLHCYTAHLSASVIPSPASSSSSSSCSSYALPSLRLRRYRRGRGDDFHALSQEDTELLVSGTEEEKQQQQQKQKEDATPEDLECVEEIRRVVVLLKKNRDMTFGEVKLTILIEDPRDIERKRLLGVDPDEITREDLVAALEDVNEGRIPENRMTLQLLAKELAEWPDLEVEAPKTSRPKKSLYAKATDTGVDPEVAAKRLNMDWDSAVDIEAEDDDENIDVPPAVGYGALYLVTGLPILIVVSVVLILFYNSLQ